MDDIMSRTRYGKAALKKFGDVPDGFEIFAAGWIGKNPKDWNAMRVTGAQFKGRKRVPNTTMTTIVTAEEMNAEPRRPTFKVRGAARVYRAASPAPPG